MTEETTELSPALRLLEAVLFASGEPMTLSLLNEQMGEEVDVPALLQELKTHYTGRGVNLVESDGIWSFRTAIDLGHLLKITKQPRRKLPKAASEVLAIIAYHQPVTRGEIESIRGVETSRGTLDILLELGWIRPGKRRETPGRPLTWKTTPDFLSHFNLTALTELPGVEELKAAGLLDARPILETMPTENPTEQSDVEDEFPDLQAED
jgi:segregation and condensation protein B